MTTLIDDPVSESTSTSTTSLILHPGPRPKAHKAAAHLKSTKARLGSQGLLVPAEGGVPPEVDLIVDVDLSGLPVHPVGHPQYERALEFRMKVEVTNTVNARKREQLTLKAWTRVYGLLSASCETTHPVLHEEMYELCRLDKRGVSGGYFDGPRCYKLYLASLTGPSLPAALRAPATLSRSAAMSRDLHLIAACCSMLPLRRLESPVRSRLQLSCVD